MSAASLATLPAPPRAGSQADERFDALLRELAATPAQANYQLAPGARLGPYEIVEPLGRGGMGEVYRARDPRLRREVAVKLVSAARAAPERVARFAKEARVLAALRHPAIPAIFDLGVHEGIPFLVMELVPGQTLRARLTRGPLPLPEAVRIAARIAEGLGAAHQGGVVHRDLKPENVILCDGQVRLLDFGLAKLLDDGGASDSGQATQTGAVLGTARYMSPEQVRGAALDQRSDVFSLGVMLYEMIAGRTPFQGESSIETMASILREDAPPLPQAVPRALERLLSRCLDRRAEERLLDGAALAQRLHALLEEGLAEAAAPVAGAGEVAAPETRYCKSGGVHLAYQVYGQGEVALVFVPGFVSQVEHWWAEPEGAAFFGRLGRFARVVLFDKRGTGLSDRVPESELPTLSQRMDDIRAVMDAAQVERAVIFGISEGGPMAVKFSQVHPERTRGLLLYGTAGSFRETMQLELLRGIIREHWGQGCSLPLVAPSRLGDERIQRWVARWERLSASPGAALAIIDMLAQTDVRPLLPAGRVPTLVMHGEGDQLVSAAGGRALAAAIPEARYVEYPGADHAPMTGGAQALLEDLEDFVRGIGADVTAQKVS